VCVFDRTYGGTVCVDKWTYGDIVCVVKWIYGFNVVLVNGHMEILCVLLMEIWR